MEKKTSIGQLEKITLLDVQKVIKDSLALEDNVKVEPYSKIVSFRAEPIDVLEIYHRLKIPFQDYTHGEKLTEEGKMVLINIANGYIKKMS